MSEINLETTNETLKEVAADTTAEELKDINTQSANDSMWVTKSLYRQSQIWNDYFNDRQVQDQRSSQLQSYYAREINRLENERIGLGTSPEQIRIENEEMQNNMRSTMTELNNQLQFINQYMYGYSGSFYSGAESVANYTKRNPVPEYNFDNKPEGAANASIEYQNAEKQFQAFQNELNNLNGLFNNEQTDNDVQIQQFGNLMKSFYEMMNQICPHCEQNQTETEQIEQKQPEKIQETKGYDEKAADGLGMIFTQEVFDNWDKVSLQEKAERVNAYAEYLNQSLGITINRIDIKEMPDNIFGQAFASEHRMELNIKMLEDPARLGKLIDTITHEARHQMQYDAILNPEKFPNISQETIESWRSNWNNYINISDDFEGYYKQPVEVDARKFAEDVMKKANFNLPVNKSSF